MMRKMQRKDTIIYCISQMFILKWLNNVYKMERELCFSVFQIK
ncbi:hypothetical protein HMPREF0653_01851 [Prevotella disiens JCM 6334 = ATCC 29426]|uniref:Uncharacterized protein n=1 Tax=Prevotella disiens JCM 6334 = ATCC 29426 TaxID=1235811 RepID=A0ABP2YA80_9BACT|nr:hypothetical protein HMPREF0653_01851 [Prevotella disiens JCM 6334 = ATCC 29426]